MDSAPLVDREGLLGHVAQTRGDRGGSRAHVCAESTRTLYKWLSPQMIVWELIRNWSLIT